MPKTLKLVVVLAAALGLAGVAKAADPVTITFSDWNLSETPWIKSVGQAMAEFEKQNPDIKVKQEPVPLGQRDVRYSTALRAGRGPDVFTLDVNPMKQFIKEGWVRDLTPFIAKEKSDFLADFNDKAMDVVREDGKVYGVPMSMLPVVLLYNKPMLKAAGITAPPKTWDEFRKVSAALAKPGADGKVSRWGTTLVLAPAGFDLRFSVILRGFGGDVLTPDNKRSALDSAAAKEAFNYMVSVIHDDQSMPPGVSQVDANGARQLMATQRVGMVFESGWAYPLINDMNPALDAWNVLKTAQVPQKDPSLQHIRSTLFLKGYFINPNTPHPEAAWKLVKFLSDKAQMERWFTQNNMLAARKSVNAELPAIRENENARTMVEELDHASFLPLIPQWPEILETVRQNLQAAVARTKTTDQALADAHAQINAILSR